LLLYEALGFTPPRFAHLALVMGPDHSPLSKRHGATSVAEFRSKGYLPEALVNYLALIGWSPGGGDELLPIDELARRFSIEGVRGEITTDGARAVVTALAEELASAPRLDRERFRAVANQVRVKTGQKAKALFHPIRIVLTGRAEGPELDLAVPAIDLGADLPESAGLPKVMGNRERAEAFAKALDGGR